MAIDIVVNGSKSEVQKGSTIEDLLQIIDIDINNATGIAIAINSEIVRRPEWKGRELNEGDVVELVTARQGG
ncbi:MAG: sulfur carrier protein ThiS [Bacteroidetes bacterium]|nr:MAG: sulfur carrier protein ThiS [Bacteroidota bacterium]